MKNDVFNIASDKGALIIELTQLIQKCVDSKNKIVIKEKRAGEVIKFIAEFSKVEQKLIHEPQRAIAKEIKKSIKWHMEKMYSG